MRTDGCWTGAAGTAAGAEAGSVPSGAWMVSLVAVGSGGVARTGRLPAVVLRLRDGRGVEEARGARGARAGAGGRSDGEAAGIAGVFTGVAWSSDAWLLSAGVATVTLAAVTTVAAATLTAAPPASD